MKRDVEDGQKQNENKILLGMSEVLKGIFVTLDKITQCKTQEQGVSLLPRLSVTELE